MNKPRTVAYAAIGAVVATMLAGIGHRLDLRGMPLNHQVAYNWLTFLLSPASFLLRITQPDGAIVPSVPFFAAIVALNSVWYAAARQFYVSVVPHQSPARMRLLQPVPAAASLVPRHSAAERVAQRYQNRLSANAPEPVPSESLVTESVRG